LFKDTITLSFVIEQNEQKDATAPLLGARFAATLGERLT
jgi:hypothetical protein